MWGDYCSYLFIPVLALLDPPPLESAIVTLRDRVTMMECTQRSILQRLHHLESLMSYTPVKYWQSEPNYHSIFPPAEPHHTPSPYPQQMLTPTQPTYHHPVTAPAEPHHTPPYPQLPQPPCQPQLPQPPCQVSTPIHHNPHVGEQPPAPVLNIKSINALPSSSISKTSLLKVEDVIAKYPKLRGENKAGALACKLAQEAIFGKDVMKRCTPNGNRELPALPAQELADLKKSMFMQFPQYWRSPVEFEPTWKKCLEAVQQACKRFRN